MVEGESQEIGALALDPDESEHDALVPQSILESLYLANDGARLALDVAGEAGTRYARGTPRFFVLRSIISSANLDRLAVIGLRLGYYTGAVTLVRSSYESLSYAFLFERRPNMVQPWLRLAADVKSGKDAPDIQTRLRRMAKEAFNESTGEKNMGQEIWTRASNLIHPTVEGLSVELGLEPQGLLPDELARALETADGDFDKAIKLASLGDKYPGAPAHARPPKEPRSNLPWAGTSLGLFDEQTLATWSGLLLYLVHRMTDFAYQTFPPIEKKVRRLYEEWHREVKA